MARGQLDFCDLGGLHGLLYLLETVINKTFKFKTTPGISVENILLMLRNFSLVTLIWVFFRSQSFGEAMVVFKSIYNNIGLADGFSVPYKIRALLIFFIITDIVLYNNPFDKWIGKLTFAVRWVPYSILLFLTIALSGVADQPFIYCQF